MLVNGIGWWLKKAEIRDKLDGKRKLHHEGREWKRWDDVAQLCELRKILYIPLSLCYCAKDVYLMKDPVAEIKK